MVRSFWKLPEGMECYFLAISPVCFLFFLSFLLFLLFLLLYSHPSTLLSSLSSSLNLFYFFPLLCIANNALANLILYLSPN